MTNSLGMIIEGVVAILLMLTVGYCMLLNRRLKLLKSDEHSLRATISELVTATEIAERAIAGLKLTVEECEVDLSTRLVNAERFTVDLDRGIAAGKDVLDRISKIAAIGAGIGVGREDDTKTSGAAGSVSQWQSALMPRQDPQAIAAAAQAFAEKLRAKVHGLAA